MFQKKNQTLSLTFTLLISSSLVIGVFWWKSHFYNTGFVNFGKNPSSKQKQKSPPSLAQKFTQVKNVPAGSFSYGGSTTWASIRNRTEQSLARVFPEYELIYINPERGSPDSAVGIEMLLNNELDFSQTSRSIKEEEHKKAEIKGFTLTEIPIAIDGIAVAVHPKMNIPGLKLDELKKIYSGEITNWKDLGGPNLKITPYSKQNEGGTVEFFLKNVLHKEKFGKNIQIVKSTTEALRRIISNRGGIYYASAPKIVTQCGVKPLPIARVGEKFVPPYKKPLVLPYECPIQRNQLNVEAFKSDEYPMTRRLFVVVKKNGQIEEEAGMAYANLMLTEEGQQLISEAGFVRIR
ncbi:PstS family phosphate ABC transporter substrate-binding protein [Mastigocoleus testarum]|uniref:Phosphate ABC transporter substrate-binding protein n=1 Tax=Mastigocoleus testarum BC008 TaxID=371196 RepID=A0A0V7ZER0_9CYAN|nr:PstS family phosphate ABC transporter substrate-binding protein [Mastigocoleus testarum]KST63060.1 phosphate ABC transporter substrate-binding protein [Mastigocoleus testarum BC008]KST69081.1 phosphate ABC transporter substrate-binding protein [Mastigocoleus testarum BC008]